MGLLVPSDAAQLIAANLLDTRAIEGFLRRLTTEIAARGGSVTQELVSSLLSIKSGPKNIEAQKRRVPPQELLDVVATFFGIKPTAIKGPNATAP